MSQIFRSGILIHEAQSRDDQSHDRHVHKRITRKFTESIRKVVGHSDTHESTACIGLRLTQRLLIAVFATPVIKIYNAPGGVVDTISPPQVITPPLPPGVEKIEFTTATTVGPLTICGTSTGLLYVYDAARRTERYLPGFDEPVAEVTAGTVQGRVIALVSSASGNVMKYSADDAGLLQFHGPIPKPGTGRSKRCVAMALHDDELWRGGTALHTKIHVQDVQRGEKRCKSFEFSRLTTGEVSALACHGHLVVAGRNAPDGGVYFINGLTKVRLGHDGEPSHPGGVTCVAVKGAIAASGGADNVVRLWNGVLGTHLRALPPLMSEVATVAFADNGRALLAGSQCGEVRMWDIGEDFDSCQRMALEAANVTVSTLTSTTSVQQSASIDALPAPAPIAAPAAVSNATVERGVPPPGSVGAHAAEADPTATPSEALGDIAVMPGMLAFEPVQRYGPTAGAAAWQQESRGGGVDAFLSTFRAAPAAAASVDAHPRRVTGHAGGYSSTTPPPPAAFAAGPTPAFTPYVPPSVAAAPLAMKVQPPPLPDDDFSEPSAPPQAQTGDSGGGWGGDIYGVYDEGAKGSYSNVPSGTMAAGVGTVAGLASPALRVVDSVKSAVVGSAMQTTAGTVPLAASTVAPHGSSSVVPTVALDPGTPDSAAATATTARTAGTTAGGSLGVGGIPSLGISGSARSDGGSARLTPRGTDMYSPGFISGMMKRETDDDLDALLKKF